MNNRIFITIFFIFLFITGFSQQKKTELEAKRKESLKKIKYTDKLLKKTSKKKKETFNRFLIIKRRIDLRNNLIKTIEEQIQDSESEISRMNKEKESLKSLLSEKKDEYKKLINIAYKRKNKYNNLMYVLAAENFNQAYKRLKYLEQYINFRKEKILEITRTKENIEVKTDSLKKEQEYLVSLFEEKKDEKRELEIEKIQNRSLLGNLKKQEKKLKAELAKQKKIADRIKKEIEKIISKATKDVKYKLTPEEKIIAGNFEKNVGKLPWPTERGIIIQKFGKYYHPIAKGTEINNNGINIATTSGSNCRAIFEGEVKSVLNIPGANKAIIIRHGTYLTVYINLINIKVKKGDKVTTKHEIGEIFTNVEDDNKTILHFEIWKEFKKLNPELWLSKN